MYKHTPGPWEYRPAMNYIGYAIFPIGTLPSLAACERYGEVMTVTCFNFPSNTEANARLIAAAPELLEALELILDYLEACAESNYIIEMVEKAISKARGE